MSPKKAKSEGLTRRQLEVLTYLAKGKKDSEIATELGVALVTVKFHVKTGRQKLGARSRVDFLIKAIRLGIIKI